MSILLHLPDVAYNFTRRKPRGANEHQLYYFASMDMCVSHTLSRHFFWNENILWKEDLVGRRVTVSLGGRDLIVNTEAVGRYLSRDEKFGISDASYSQDRLIDIEDARSLETSRLMHRDPLSHGVEGPIDGEDWKYGTWSGGDLDVLWNPDLDHAQIFDDVASRGRLVKVIQTYSHEGR